MSNEFPWCIVDSDGNIYDRFATDVEAQEATYEKPYSDGDFSVAYVNEPDASNNG